MSHIFTTLERWMVRRGFHHGHRHLTVAVFLCILSLSPAFAAGVYSGREVRDLEKSHNWDMKKFDWRGFLWPVIPMALLHVLLMGASITHYIAHH